MPEPFRESSDHPVGQPWGGAVIAAGAVLAGLALGRSGRLGLAAGVAAAAGLKLLSASRSGPGPSEGNGGSDTAEDALPTKPAKGDWVDSDAVFFDHLVPVGAVPLPEPKSLPLLDEDGQPVSELEQPPVLPLPDSYGFPLGPLIWEPGRSVQSRSDTVGETVWFGLSQDQAVVVPETPAVGTPVLPVQEAPAVETAPIEVPHGSLEEQLMPAPSAEAPVLPVPEVVPPALAEVPVPLPVPVVQTVVPAPLPEMPSTFLLLPDEELEEVVKEPASTVSPAVAAPVEAALPLPWAMGAQPAVEIVSKPVKRGLPEPRRSGELPRAGFSATPEGAPGTDTGGASSQHPVLAKLLPVEGLPEQRGMQRFEPGHRLTPLAPVRDEARSNRWPLVMTLLLLLLMAAFLAAGWWRDGELLRKAESAASGWFGQGAVPEDGHGQQGTPRSGPWMSALPEP